MPTARDIIQGALEQIRVYSPAEQASDPDIARGFVVLNDMLDSWSNENLACYAILEQSCPLVPGQQQYTIGPGGNVNGTRPLKLINTPGSAYIQDPNGQNYPLDVIEKDFWNLIGNRSSIVTANVPNTLYYDSQYPLGFLNFYPVPNQGGYTAYFDSWLQLTDFGTLSTAMSFPPGYKKAIQDNLAIELEVYFPMAVITPALMRAAAMSKGNIKRTNQKEVIALYDAEIVAKPSQSSYNIYTDGPNR